MCLDPHRRAIIGKTETMTPGENVGPPCPVLGHLQYPEGEGVEIGAGADRHRFLRDLRRGGGRQIRPDPPQLLAQQLTNNLAKVVH